MNAAALANLGVHYVTASARDACRNCKHGHEVIADRMPPYDTRSWQCRRFDQSTTALAICNKYERESHAATAAKQA